jgi:hypothetical protein
MTTYSSLGELEEAQDDATRAARERIEHAEEFVDHYRAQMRRMQEDFYHLAAREGVADDPGFSQQLQRVTERTDEEVRSAARVIAGFEEDLETMTSRHTREREDHLQQQRTNSDHSR